MKQLITIIIGTGAVFLAMTSPALAATYTKIEFLTVMLNYEYSDNYTVKSASHKCGDTKSNVNTNNIAFDIDELNAKGKASDASVYFNGINYTITGNVKKKANKGIYKINMTGEYEDASGTSDVTVTGSLKKKNPYTIKQLKIQVDEHRKPIFTIRECTAKGVFKNLEADTSMID